MVLRLQRSSSPYNGKPMRIKARSRHLSFQQKEAGGAMVQGMTVHTPGDYISEDWRVIWPNNIFWAHYSDSKSFKLLWHWERSGFLWVFAIRSANHRLQ